MYRFIATEYDPVNGLLAKPKHATLLESRRISKDASCRFQSASGLCENKARFLGARKSTGERFDERFPILGHKFGKRFILGLPLSYGL